MSYRGDTSSTAGVASPVSEEEDLNPPVPTENRETASEGVGGFFTNLFRDVKDIGTGIGDVIGIAAHDVVHGVAEAATLGQAEGGFQADDVVKAMPGAIIGDYKNRYGGGIGNIAENIYEHPLSFLSDALTIATAGGAGIVKVGQLTGNLGKAAEIAGAATKAADIANAASKAGNFATAATTLKAARDTSYAGAAATATASDVTKMSTFWEKVGGKVRFYRDPETGHVSAVTPTLNPVKRQAENVMERLMTTPGKVDDLAEISELTDTLPGAAVDMKMAAQAATDTEHAGEALRVYRPLVAKMRLNKMADHLYGSAKATAKARQLELMREYQDGVKKIMAAKPGITEEGAGELMSSMDVDAFNDGYVPTEGAGPRITEHFDDPEGPDINQNDPADWLGWDVNRWGTALDAQKQALLDQKAIIPALRKRLGMGVVVPGGAKSTEAIGLKGAVHAGLEHLGGWRTNDDISRSRVMLGSWSDFERMRGEVLATLQELDPKAKIRRMESSIYKPDAGGERGARIVFEYDGHPVEFEFMTPGAAEVKDATTGLRKVTKQMAVLLNDKAYTGDRKLLEQNFFHAQEYSKTLWEGITDEVRHEVKGHDAGDLRRAFHDTRLAVHKNITDRAIEDGMLSPTSAFQDSYLMLRLREGAHWDYENGDFVDDIGTEAMHSATVNAGMPAPIYTPMVDARRLTGKGDWLQSKTTPGLRGLAKDAHMRRNTGYLFEKGYYEKNPIRAMAVRAQRATRARESRDVIMGAVSQFGRPMANAQDFNPDAEMVVSLSQLKKVFSHQRAIEDAGLRALTGTDDVAGQPIKSISEGAGAETAVSDVLEAISSDNPEAARRLGSEQLYAVPKVVGKRINDQSRAWFGSSKVSVAWSTSTKAWKSAVLAGSPRWVSNNLIGNIVFAKLQGASLVEVLKQLSPKHVAKLREAFGPGALGEVEQGGIFGANEVAQAGEIGTALHEDTIAGRLAARISGVSKAVPHPAAKFGEVLRGANGKLEDAFRRASYLKAAERQAIKAGTHKGLKSFFSSKDKLESVFGVGLDENQWRAAVDEVNRAFNDYSAMSPIGRQIVRPYIAPFWGFYRHATKTLLTMPYEHPAKAWLMTQLAITEDGMNEDIGQLPSWLAGSTILGPGAKASETRFLSTRGPNPFNAVLETPFNLLHPAWKMAFERGTGRSSYTGNQFSSADVGTAYGSDQQMRVSYDDNGQPIVEPIDTNAPSLIEMALQQIPQYELVKDAVARGKTYDTASLLDAFRGRGTMVDSETGEARYPTGPLRSVAKWLGYNYYDYDVEAYQEQLAEEQASVLKQIQERQGVTGETTGGGRT